MVITDDLDGSPGAGTVSFGIDGALTGLGAGDTAPPVERRRRRRWRGFAADDRGNQPLATGAFVPPPAALSSRGVFNRCACS